MKVMTDLEAIERIAGEYERAGYDVIVQPTPDLLPSSLRKFQPDLLARGEKESVVVEVKSRRELANENVISTLATEIRKLKGWRLEVQFVESPLNDRDTPLMPLSLEEVDVRLDSATLLLSRGDAASALVLAWSAFEAILRQISWKADVPIAPWNGRRAAKQLLSMGLLARSEYDLFMRGLELRNQVVHGGAAGRSVKRIVHSVVSAVRRLAEHLAGTRLH